MPKIYTQNTWTDEVLAGPERYDIKTNAGAAIESNVQVNLATSVTTAGSSVDATKMNNIEDGIDALDTLLSGLLSAATELTISSDAITVTQSNHKLQPQTGTTDNLSTINGTTAGQSGVLYASDYGTDTITLKHNVGNILCLGGSDVALSSGCVMWYSDGTKIFVAGGGGGSSSFSWPATALSYAAQDDRVLIYDVSASADKYIEAQNLSRFGAQANSLNSYSITGSGALVDYGGYFVEVTSTVPGAYLLCPAKGTSNHAYIIRNTGSNDVPIKLSDTTTVITTLKVGDTCLLIPSPTYDFKALSIGMLASNNLSDLASASTARTNLGMTANGSSLVTAADYAAMRTLLGLVISTNVQAYHARLADLAGITYAQGDVLYFNGSNIVKLAAGTSGQYLKTQGTGANPTWASISGGGDMLAANNLSDLVNAATARTNLGVAIGSNVQAYDADLAALAGLTSAADALPYFTGAGTASTTTLTSFARTLLDDAAATNARTTLGVVIGTDVQAQDAELSAIAGLASAADSAPYFTGSGTAALMTVTSTARTVLDDTTTAAMLTTLGALPVAGGTLTGVVDLGENAGLILDAALSADGKYSGITEAGTAGATLAFGDLCYLSGVDSRWELVDANAAATCANKLGMCVLAAAADGSATTMLLFGKIRADANFPALTVGAPVFAATTAGDIQTTAPSGAADIIRIIGYGNTADELYFNPANDYYEHA